MPRYEYIDGDGNARLIYAPDFATATDDASAAEYRRTGALALADRAAGTVEVSDERSRAA